VILPVFIEKLSPELHLGLKHRKQTLRQLGDQLLLGQQNLNTSSRSEFEGERESACVGSACGASGLIV